MKSTYAVIAVATVLALPAIGRTQPAAAAAAAAAAAPRPNAAPTQATAEAANAELTALAVRIKGLEALETESLAMLDTVLTRMDTVVAMAERHATKAEVRAWADRWEPALKAQAASLRQRVSAFPDVKLTDYPLLAVASQINGMDVGKLSASATRRKAGVLETVTIIESLAANQRLAATGDLEAMRRLGSATMVNVMLLLRNENNGLEGAMAALPANSPNRDFAASVLGSNQAMITLMELAADTIEDKKVDGKAVAADMRVHIGEGRAAAAAMRRHAADAARQIETGPVAESELARKTLAAVKTFDASADVEVKVLAYLESLAAKVEAGDDAIAAFSGDSDAFEKLVDERVKLQTTRTTLLAR